MHGQLFRQGSKRACCIFIFLFSLRFRASGRRPLQLPHDDERRRGALLPELQGRTAAGERGVQSFFCIELEGYMGEARAALGGGEPDFFSFGGLGWKCCKVFLCPPLVFGSQNSAVFK